MKNIKRYDLECKNYNSPSMDESENGEFVRYEDVMSILADAVKTPTTPTLRDHYRMAILTGIIACPIDFTIPGLGKFSEVGLRAATDYYVDEMLKPTPEN